MKLQPAVKKETTIIAIGVILMTALLVGIFALAGYFDMTILWGAVLGAALSILNFFLLGLGVQAAAEKMNVMQQPSQEEQQEDESEPEPGPQALQAKRLVQLSYHGRMLLCIIVMILALVIPVFNVITAAIPLLFPRLIILGQGVAQRIKEGK